MEPLGGRLAKFRGEFQVVVGAHWADMPQVGCKVRQLGLNVSPIGVTLLEEQNSTAVPQVMKPWRMALRIDHLGTDASLMPDGGEAVCGIDLRLSPWTPHQKGVRRQR